ncbi:MAG TPA: hypothetical protein DCZ71_00235 [Ruminococcus sp.]|nr:hypothetical protein [Ruminococcus sp.]
MALFKKKMTHQVTEDTCKNHLDVMRANYHEAPVTSKSLPKPLWIRLHRKDALNVVYRDKDTVFSKGEIYYGCIVQANEMLFQKGNNLDLPANVIYSTHPIAEEYPGFLRGICHEIFSYKGKPAEEVPVEYREIVRIITDEVDRSDAMLTVSMPHPEDDSRTVENIDLHFCSVIVFHKDIPGGCLQGSYLPVIAAPELSPAVLILPKEYWTAPYYELD